MIELQYGIDSRIIYIVDPSYNMANIDNNLYPSYRMVS